MPRQKKQRRTRLEKLQNSWEKASLTERAEFLRWTESAGDPRSEALLPARQPVPIATGRYLTPEAAYEIAAHMKARGIALGELKMEIGLSEEDGSLARAMTGRASLRLSVVARLEVWLARQRELQSGSSPDQ